MTNFEKYYKTLAQSKSSEDSIMAVNFKSGEPMRCNAENCKKCLFDDNDEGCATLFARWLCSEAVEMLSEEEHQFCKNLGSGYISKIDDKTVIWLEGPPTTIEKVPASLTFEGLKCGDYYKVEDLL